MNKGTTLVEFIFATVIAVVAIVLAFVLSVDFMRAATQARQNSLQHTDAGVALLRMEQDLSAAQTFESSNGSVSITLSGQKVRWAGWTSANNEHYLLRYTQTPANDGQARRMAVAAAIRGVSVQKGPAAQTISVTVDQGKHTRRIYKKIEQVGVTL